MNVALIGYGEVGRILGEDLRAVGHSVTTFDVRAWMADLADAGLFGKKRYRPFTRRQDWRIEADRILDDLKTSKED